MSVRSEVRGAAYWIIMDRPQRSNALNIEMYDELCSALDDANDSEDTLITVFTGVGDCYSSGNDFTPEEMAKCGYPTLDYEHGFSKFVRRLLIHQKVLMGLVNGPAMGISCTTLGLFDYVVCSDSAYFLCPFSTLGVSPEGVSSAIFQRIMGTSNATEMLLFNEPMSAEQALQRGYVSRVFTKAEFVQKTTELVEKYSKLPKHSVLASKELCRGQKWRREMLSVHNDEYDLLRVLFVDERSLAQIMKKFPKNKI
ncbi:hypothetical protein PENTCL1PPCAC_16531 [Pristionchus entomophagus]|uniref:Uncharacterized protein n=1 Tax=Pristionchus entomophagus TaxID=358040 RepID=A0AAV5TJ92_9BILA|nr:hypothetical protein PENTCL1PPCAC_16531 [Pristionchus entomophagus]